MSYMPVRGGTRGGQDQFQWDDVKADKHRENYLGHSVMAPVGRWQKGKDLSWYSKKSKVLGQKEILEAEIAAVKRAEEDAMAAALGLKPKRVVTGAVSKQELAEVCRRQSVEEKEEEGQEERIKGLGYMSHRLSHRHSNQATATGAAMFESNPVHEGETSKTSVETSTAVMDQQQVSSTHQSSPVPTTSSSKTPSTRDSSKEVWADQKIMKTIIEQIKKDKKKKKKKGSRKKHKKVHRSRKHDYSSSDDSDQEASGGKKGHNNKDSEKEDGGRRRKEKKDHRDPSSDSEDGERVKRRKREYDREKRRHRDDESDDQKRGRRRNEDSHNRTEDQRKHKKQPRQRHDSSSD